MIGNVHRIAGLRTSFLILLKVIIMMGVSLLVLGFLVPGDCTYERSGNGLGPMIFFSCKSLPTETVLERRALDTK